MFDGLDDGVHALLVPTWDIARWVERVRPHIAKMAAGSGGRYETSDIIAELAGGAMLLWVVLDGARIAAVMVTQVMAYPRARAMRCIGIVGSRPRRWMHLLAVAERVSKQQFGCSIMEAMVQPGHERLLRTGGWKLFHSLWEKPLCA